jgi:hypothetical protein
MLLNPLRRQLTHHKHNADLGSAKQIKQPYSAHPATPDWWPMDMEWSANTVNRGTKPMLKDLKKILLKWAIQEEVRFAWHSLTGQGVVASIVKGGLAAAVAHSYGG